MLELKRKILIADDDAISLRVLKEYLLTANYPIVEATHGKQAWELLQQSPDEFVLAIIDRVMPHLHGIDLVRKMKQHPLLKDTPVIMLTGISEKEEVIEALRAGVNEFLYKPVEKELLIAVVKKILVGQD